MARIYFVTNRNPLDLSGSNVVGQDNDFNKIKKFGNSLSNSGLSDLRFAVLKEPYQIKTDAGDIHKIDVYKTYFDKANNIYGSYTMFEDLRQSMINGENTLVFIHGFNTSFQESLNNGIKLFKNFNGNTNIVLFSWPSDGDKTHYYSDREEAIPSGVAISRGLEKLFHYFKSLTEDKLCNGKINLMCHSMGNYVLRHALQDLKKKRLENITFFNEVVLVAADEDNDAFDLEYKLLPLNNLCQQITLYFNKNDKILFLSDNLKGNPPRLGQFGITRPLNPPSKLVLVDVSDMDIPFTESHSYFIDYSPVINDIKSVITGTQTDNISFKDVNGNDYKRIYIQHANKYKIVSSFD